LSESEAHDWSRVVAAGVKAQQLMPGAIAVGGMAAALYAHHRVSNDTDHLLASLRDNFDATRQRLERAPEWKTARLQPPVLILGSLGGVQVGFRQSRRKDAIDSVTTQTDAGPLTLPTLDEMIGMKAYLVYARNAVRDYLDFAALASCTDEANVLASLLKSDRRYGHLQTASVGLEIAKRLCDPQPYDLSEIDLRQYKGLAPQWQSWPKISDICRRHGAAMASRMVFDQSP